MKWGDIRIAMLAIRDNATSLYAGVVWYLCHHGLLPLRSAPILLTPPRVRIPPPMNLSGGSRFDAQPFINPIVSLQYSW